MTVKKFNILVAEEVDVLLRLAQSTLLKHCAHINLEVAANLKEIKEKLNTFSPDLIVVSENLDLGSKKLLKWLNKHPVLRERLYGRAKTDNLERLVPPDHLNSSFSLSGIHFWALLATKEGEKRQLERYNVQGSVIILMSGKRKVCGSLINVAGGGVLGLFPREGKCPPIAEKVLLDFGPVGKSTLIGFSGFPVRIQAERPEFKCANIQIAVKFKNLTEKHASQLKNYIEAHGGKAVQNKKKKD